MPENNCGPELLVESLSGPKPELDNTSQHNPPSLAGTATVARNAEAKIGTAAETAAALKIAKY